MRNKSARPIRKVVDSDELQPMVVLTHELPAHIVRKELDPHFRVKIASTPGQLKAALKTADGLVTLLTVAITKELLDGAPHLKAIGNVAVGFNNIDLKACAQRGIRVTNTPDVLTGATAELTLALLLAVAKRIPEGETLCREGKFKGWEYDMLLGQELKGRRAVILGRGSIGVAFSKLLLALGVQSEFITRGDSPASIAEKLSRAQIFSIHVPYSTETHHWLNAKRIAALPADAIVLNTARGPIVDETALIAALKAKKIFGAGLDVFEAEPKSPAALKALTNVVLLPHLGSATQSTREAMARLACSGVAAILMGKNPSNEVKLEK